MRLINTSSKELVTVDDHFPRYAILSHTWGKEEITYQDILNPQNSKHKKGWHKITRACKQAFNDGHSYIWIDTCCIDQSSSAELSESINSMFKWYEKATVCYAFLEDIAYRPNMTLQDFINSENFAQSRWFTRGWTLQELIAPTIVQFYDGAWTLLGEKIALFSRLEKITGTPSTALLRSSFRFQISLAARMSWIAKRETTRPEDKIYCLLGIFDVNMPLIYGEGEEKAFFRLFKDILEHLVDQTLIAWDTFAKSPLDFKDAYDIISCSAQLPQYVARPPQSFTRMGFRIELPIVLHSSDVNSASAIFLCSTPENQHQLFAHEIRNNGQDWVAEGNLHFVKQEILTAKTYEKQVVFFSFGAPTRTIIGGMISLFDDTSLQGVTLIPIVNQSFQRLLERKSSSGYLNTFEAN
jgi:hypothetical protein